MGMFNRKQFAKWKPGDRVKPKTVCGPSKTKQEFRNECDINKVVGRFLTTGQLPVGSGPSSALVFADVSKGPGSFHEAMNRVRKAEEAFATLDPKIRSRFHGDPAELISFLNDPQNREEAVKLGLVNPPKPAEAPPAPKPAEGKDASKA